MTAYYNEYDPKAAAWLRELIRGGLIADGVVDERSILDVEPADLAGFTQCHFFAGIGGWSLALRLAGWSDNRPVWTGSPPCQPFSAAGRQLGKEDERHLAPHFASLVAACQPATLFGEQVASAAVFGKASGRSGKSAEGQTPPEWAWLDDLFERLEAAHYACGASDIPAAGVGAAHIRQRTFFGAQRLDYPASPRHDGPLTGPEGLARDEAWLRLSGAGSGHGGLAHSLHAGRPERRPLAGHGSAAGGSGGLCGLADANANGPLDGHNAADGRTPAAIAKYGGAFRLGDPGGPTGQRNASAEGLQRGGQHRQQPQDGGIGRLADTSRSGRQQLALLAGSDGARSSAGQEGVQPRDNGLHPDDPRWPDAPDSPWSTADWLFCRDGKWRPVEPGTFPLAHGVSARVGRLRGYGNAIFPQAATEFIKAFDDAAECLRLNDLSIMTTDNEGVFG